MRQFHRWYEPALQRERERRKLELQATRLIQAPDRRRNKIFDKYPAATAAPPGRRRFTLSDLRELRRQGLVP